MTVNAPRALEAPPIALTPLRIWAPPLLSIALALVAFGVAFQYEIVGAVTVWTGSTAYNHCFLVLPLAGYLLWNRRHVLASLTPSPAWWPLALLPPVAAAWLGAALLDVLEVEELAVMAMFEILLLTILGWRTFRALAAPLLFLFFLVPFGAFVVPVLQRFTAAFTARGLEFLGIPTFVDGFTIQIPEGSFQVAEACAGLRFLIASIVFGCLFATVVYHSKLRRLGFIVVSVVVPIIANGFRALGLVVLAHVEGSAAAMEADHILYGWLFFSIVVLLLVFIGMTLSDRPETQNVAVAMPAKSPPRLKLGLITAIGLLFATAGPVYLAVIERASAAPLSLETSGLAPAGNTSWRIQPDASIEWTPDAWNADAKLNQSYRDGDQVVNEFVAAYRFPTRGNPLTRSMNTIAESKSWHIVRSDSVISPVKGSTVTVATTTIVHQGHYRTVWWFYVVDGRVTASRLQAKLLQARASLRGGEHLGAFVAISTPTSEAAEPSPPALLHFLSAIAPQDGRPS